MGCTNCSTEGGVPKGCKSNGSCGTGSCGKLSVFDWLADIELPNGQSSYDLLEIRFKGSRKGFYRNIKNINLQVGDVVAVEASPGYDIGVVSVVGELARIQVRKKAPNLKAHDTRSILRKGTKEDIEKWMKARERESETMFSSRSLATQLGLQMKISDVEYQGDGGKATFYYTADDRVDFRQLIRNLAESFKVKIEMKQIGVRQEAARLGGIGSCGRELCCSTWLTDFRSVSTASARYQQLSLNPQKLAGQCGKLKCCLNYELDAYLDALKKFPRSDIRLKTKKGIAFHVKTDVFKEQMWYIQEDKENPGSSGFIPLTPERVKDIIKMNKEGEFPTDLKDFMVEIEEEEIPDYTDVVGQDSLNRFEHVFKRNKKKKRKGKGQRPQGGQQKTNSANGNAKGGENPDQKKSQGQGNRKKTAKNKGPRKNDGQQKNKPQNNSQNAVKAEGDKQQQNKRRKPRNPRNNGDNKAKENNPQSKTPVTDSNLKPQNQGKKEGNGQNKNRRRKPNPNRGKGNNDNKDASAGEQK